MDEFRRLTPEEEAIAVKRKKILVAIAMCGILLVILTIFVIILKAQDSKTFKLFVNGMQVRNSDSFLISQDGETYVAVKELAGYINYKYQNGEYSAFEESNDSGYIQSNYEVASFTSDSNVLKKYIKVSQTLNPAETGITVLSENGSCETTTLDKPILKINDMLYIPLSSLADICNCSYSMNGNIMNIYSLEYLIEQAKVLAPQLQYNSISGDYENLRALAYGMMVVYDGDNYGVVSMTNGESLMSPKYTSIEFIQNVKEFFVKTKDGVGILNSKTEVVIPPTDFDDIAVLSDELSLYLVSENGKYGILNREGKTIVHAEFDEVGIGQDIIESFDVDTDDLVYIPYDNLIVAKRDDNIAIYNIEGKEQVKLTFNYTGIGCTPKNIDESLYDDTDEKINKINDAEKVLTIDLELENGTGIKGIVVKQYVSTLEVERYGIFDSLTGKVIIPPACSQIYGITKNGRTKYYMEFEGEQLELVEYIEAHESDLSLAKYE